MLQLIYNNLLHFEDIYYKVTNSKTEKKVFRL